MATMGARPGQRKCESCGKMFFAKDDRFRTCYDCGPGRRDQGPNSAPAGGDGGDLHGKFQTYLKQLREHGYFDAQGNMPARMRVDDAQIVAQVLANAGVTAGQLRRFFTMSRALEQQLGVSSDFAALVPEIARLQPLAAALVGREQNSAQRNRLQVLHDFIDANAVRARESERAFRKGFLSHFESVIAYFTFYKPK